MALAALLLAGCDPWDWNRYDYDAGAFGHRDLAGLPGADAAVLPDLAMPPADLLLVDLAGCPGQPCDPICQSACPAGDKCALDGKNAFACMAAGSVAPGQWCGTHGYDDCAPGALCLAVTATGGSVCFAFCRTDGDCGSGSTCSIAVAGTSLSVCTSPVDHCKLVPVGGCGAGSACYPVTTDGQSGCHASGMGTQAAACTGNYDCAPGFACFTTPAGCQPICRLGGTDCQTGTTCTAVPDWPGGTYGVCH